MASAIFMNMDSTTLSTTSTFAPRDIDIVVGDEPFESLRDQKSQSPISPVTVKDEPRDPKNAEIVPISPPTSKPTPIRPRPKTKASPDATYLELSEKESSPKFHNFWVLPPPIRNSQVLNHQFLSHFINFFAIASPRDVIFNSWMASLPEMLASPKYHIDKSIAAASMMYYGRRTSNKMIMMEAYKSYGASLLNQRKYLCSIFNGTRKPTIEELCIPLLMSYFEIICCTSPTAYFQHLCGAGSLLGIYGPEKCSEGILFELFHALRLQLVRPSILPS